MKASELVGIILNTPESTHQKLIVKWFAFQYKEYEGLLKAFNNSEYIANPKMRVIKGAQLKAMGVVAGTPDLFLSVPIEPYKGLYVEVKKIKGKLSAVQKIEHKRLLSQGYEVKTAYGHSQGIDYIKEYLNGVL